MTDELQFKSKSDLFDGRERGDFKTRYTCAAWRQIAIEASYLLLVTIVFVVLIVLMLSAQMSGHRNGYDDFLTYYLGDAHSALFRYCFVAKFGVVGGALFSIKWLIHSTAKGFWSVDRILWRFFTPLTGGITAVGFAAVLQSGIISIFEPASFRSLQLSAAFGFLVGYFSDGVIGVLSNVANVLFGTIRDSKTE